MDESVPQERKSCSLRRTVRPSLTVHPQVCGSVKFIPDRPNEMISGGYDCALLHFDFTKGTLLARLDLGGSHDIVPIATNRILTSLAAPPPPSQSSGVSLSPPFVLATAFTPTGLFAASTADGRVWLGGGGEKRPAGTPAAKKKKTRKWEGLKDDEGLWLQVADGPVVAVYVCCICLSCRCLTRGGVVCSSGMKSFLAVAC